MARTGWRRNGRGRRDPLASANLPMAASDFRSASREYSTTLVRRWNWSTVSPAKMRPAPPVGSSWLARRRNCGDGRAERPDEDRAGGLAASATASLRRGTSVRGVPARCGWRYGGLRERADHHRDGAGIECVLNELAPRDDTELLRDSGFHGRDEFPEVVTRNTRSWPLPCSAWASNRRQPVSDSPTRRR